MKKKNNYKVAVLSNLKTGSDTALKNAIGFARMIDGEVEIFHVKSSADVVRTDNQFSALRSMKDEFAATDKNIRKFIDPIASEYDVKISHHLGFGNIKKEIDDYLNSTRPDIVVMGRRKSNPLDFIGDGVTEHVLSHFDGIIMIASLNETIVPDSELSLGILNGTEPPKGLDIFNNLMGYAKKPIKSFSFIDGAKGTPSGESSADGSVVQFVFEKGASTASNLSNYVSKNNINLLWIDNPAKRDSHQEQFVPLELKNVVGNINVPLFMTRGRKYSEQKLTN